MIKKYEIDTPFVGVLIPFGIAWAEIKTYPSSRPNALLVTIIAVFIAATITIIIAKKRRK
ncbi:MAG: hypothetical protein FWE44_00130 [Defluviitaleaceae bacterium]|nr:hypothetical protein [Defluviitaleaceae bacterium]